MIPVLLASLFFLPLQQAPPLPPGHPVVSGASYVPQRVFDTRQKAFSDFESMLADLARADAVFVGDQEAESENGRWRFRDKQPASWPMRIKGITATCRFSNFRHVGVFPEQLPLIAEEKFPRLDPR